MKQLAQRRNSAIKAFHASSSSTMSFQDSPGSLPCTLWMHALKASDHLEHGRPTLRARVGSSAAFHCTALFAHLSSSRFQIFKANFHLRFRKTVVQSSRPESCICCSACLVVSWIHSSQGSRRASSEVSSRVPLECLSELLLAQLSLSELCCNVSTFLRVDPRIIRSSRLWVFLSKFSRSLVRVHAEQP